MKTFRYLLLSTIPTIMAVLGLFWLPESPRYLLENGREVEALTIYQVYTNMFINTFKCKCLLKINFF